MSPGGKICNNRFEGCVEVKMKVRGWNKSAPEKKRADQYKSMKILVFFEVEKRHFINFQRSKQKTPFQRYQNNYPCSGKVKV
jgi:hypothetical protein